MITPAYALTATERVLPRLALDFTTASLDPRVTVTRALNTATRVNSSGFVESINANLPRFDFDPVTKVCKGLLIEEARTNTFTRSEDFNNAAWTKTRSSIGATPVSSPSGLNTALKLVEDTTPSSTHFIVTQFAVTAAAGAWSNSFYLKAGERTRAQVNMSDNATGALILDVNLSNGTFTSSSSGTWTNFTASVVNAGDGWYRCSVSGTQSSGFVLPRVFIADNAGNTTYTGDGTSGIFIWGAQLEAGAFATSYIPTVASTVTRNADVVSMTGTNFSSWFNAAQGTLAVSATGYDAPTAAQGGTAPTAVSLYAAAAVNPYASIAISRRDNATLNSPSGFIVSDAGSVGMDVQRNTVSWRGATVSAAIAWNGSTDAAFTANGVAVATDASYTLPTSDSLQIGRWGSETVSGYWSGYIRRVSFYPQRLTNAELQAITA